ncbi:MAG: DUF3616 domain-containing protein [Rhodospirillales bacterium]|nr:DUF3616 domain-containing protein [Rhodospirillales bacterium]
MATMAQPERRIRLDFRRQEDRSAGAPASVLRGDLSACAITGDCLWLGCDETATVERLIRQAPSTYADHRSFQLADIFSLPAGAGEEIDIEGLAADDGYLWIVGSHSSKRKKPRRHENDAREALERLSTISIDPNRYFLARVPLVAGAAEGLFGLAGFDGSEASAGRSAACLPMSGGGNVLTDALGRDPLLGTFLRIPCKENGLDIEGIAVRGGRVFLGLRGPVLGGWATIIELAIRDDGPGRLGLDAIGGAGETYARRFFDLDGLGIRDLAFADGALLILAGPTMDLDGPVRLYRWPMPLEAGDGAVITHDRLEVVFDMPYGDGVDHAEGIALLDEGPDAGRREILVVHDSPAPDRLHGDGTAIDADVFSLGPA